MSMAVGTGKTQNAYEITEFGIDLLRTKERAAKILKPNEVRVKVVATSLNFRDLLVVKGLYNKRLPFPLIPFSDGAGEVIEVGELVTRVKVGDRVAAAFMQMWISGGLKREYGASALGGAVDGMLADHVVLHEEGLLHFPEHLSFEEAAALPCAGVTAWNALIETGGIKAGDTVLALGTGGVSLFALQFAKMSGARVIITSSSDEKLNKARALGASDCVNYRTHDDWDKQVLELTNGDGVDHVVEVGGAGTLDRSMKSVKPGGCISVIGVLAGGAGFSPMPLLMKNVCAQGIYVGSRQHFENMNVAISHHKIRPVIDKVFAFNEVKEALKYMESGSHFGKIVLRVNQ